MPPSSSFRTYIQRKWAALKRGRARRILRDAQNPILSLIEQAPISIAMFDRDMRYLVTSQRWRDDFGKKRFELTGQSHYEVHPDLPEVWKEIHRRGLGGEFLHNDEDRWVDSAGVERWLRWAVQPWRNAHGEIGGIIISSEDISERKRAEQALRANQQVAQQQERLRALGQLASGIAHDINNALSPAALYIQSLLERDTTLSAQAREHLTVVGRAIDDVAQTVARMREFSRARTSANVQEPVDLNQIAEEAVALTRVRWQDMPQETGKVIRVKVDLAPELPTIQGAENELRDAIVNLIMNAVDAMPEGGTLGVHTEVRPSGEVSLEVRDTGVGMDATTKQHCLEPFFTTKGERGSGLGLAMVYGMLERHDGHIDIESAPAQGTAMRLRFPARPTEVASVEVTDERPFLQGLRILLVDDDPLLLTALRLTLEQDQHTIVTAEGGEAGIEAMQSARKTGERFSVVVTDLGMPHVDGRQVAAAAKSIAPEVPVILLTGWGHQLKADRAQVPHVDRILSKPPVLEELRSAFAQLVG